VIAYLDSSVILRIVLDEAGQLAEWSELTVGVSSALLSVECHRSLDRLWQQGRLSQEVLANKTADVHVIMHRLELAPLDDSILETASRPFPTALGTLDALHLATAIRFRATQPPDERPILFATHDVQLARAARAMRFDVLGAAV
jgi:predicted nucleic acid-binding protein